MGTKKPFKVINPSSLKAAHCENQQCQYAHRLKKPRILFKRNMAILEVFCPSCQTKHVYQWLPEGYRIIPIEPVDGKPEKVVKHDDVTVPTTAIHLLLED